MDVNVFGEKYNIAQIGRLSTITVNLNLLGNALMKHSPEERLKIIEEMCDVECGIEK